MSSSRSSAASSLKRLGKKAWRKVRPTFLGSPVERERAKRARLVRDIERGVRRVESRRGEPSAAPVLYFNASSHLSNFSLNAAVGLLSAWGLRLAGQPVVYLVCQSGLHRCVLGTKQHDVSALPPCAACTALNTRLYPGQQTVTLPPLTEDEVRLRAEIASLPFDQLADYHHEGINIGRLCLPSVRWILRRGQVDTLPQARQLLGEYVASATRLARKADGLLEQIRPRSLMLYNGSFYPEATMRALAEARGIPVVSFEAGHQETSAFFAHGVATEYVMPIPDSFVMGDSENAELDAYLSKRVRGDFTMADVRFWPEMQDVSEELAARARSHKQVVSVFTNVVFDTSQLQANILFKDMFDWLDETLGVAVEHSEALFVVRAHPDELRPGKASQEPVEDWLRSSGYLSAPNVAFIPPTEYVSSYALVRLSNLSLAYNSTIGLEATVLGSPVLMGGHSRFSDQRITHNPASRAAYREMLSGFLERGVPPLPDEWRLRARRYLYYSLFRASLRFSHLVRPIADYDYALSLADAGALARGRSEEMAVIYDGVVNGRPFHYGLA